jgi:GST-like protein
MLDLYYWPTPNGRKVTILLEECGVSYAIKPVNIQRGDQFAPGFLKMSPNNRMPALVDSEPKGGGAPITIFESGAIMMYVAEKAGKFFPSDVQGRYDVIQWVMWQMGNQGPKFGEQGHFFRAAQAGAHGDLAYANRRFGDEVHRLYGVLELGLHKKQWLAANQYTIADMICYPWAMMWKYPWLASLNLDDFPNVKRWLARIGERPAVQKAMAPQPEFQEDASLISEAEKARRAKLLVNQRAIPIPKEWY